MKPLLFAAFAFAFAIGTAAHSAEPKVQILPAAEDATQKTVLIGRNSVNDMIIMFELEPAKAMWMEMRGRWVEHAPAKGERHHVEVKPIDPKSKARISYATVTFSAVNRDTGKKISGTLHPMWGGSGLHYAMNSPLAGDGRYEATIVVGVPTFGRAPQDKSRWMKPASTTFHFRLMDGKVVEVTEPQVDLWAMRPGCGFAALEPSRRLWCRPRGVKSMKRIARSTAVNGTIQGMKIFAMALGLVMAWPLPGAQAQSPEERGLAIATEAKRLDTGFGDSSAELLMVLRDVRGAETTREMRSQVLERPDDGDRSLVIFETPRDVRGTAMLTYANRVDEDDQWLYLPALKRVRRISAANRSGPFMGSEFAYEDFASQEVEKFTYKWLRDEACPGEEYAALACYVIERHPVDASSGYSRQVVWIDREHYRTVKIDYYDRKGARLKTLELKQYKQYLGRFWRPGEMLMSNHQTGRSTRLVWKRYEFGAGLRESDFTPQALTRLR